MKQMNHDHFMQAVSSFPLTACLAGFFLLATIFYCFRLFSASYLIRVNGHIDNENEIWHGACMLGMVSCLTPNWLGIPELFWQITFAIGTVWYLVRALTYGCDIPYNKKWYDFAHAAMTFGMFSMFVFSASGLLKIVLSAYWTWFGSYYAVRFYNDLKKPHWLSFGQDIAHFVMALVMVLMILFPANFHHHQTGDHNQIMSCQSMPDMPECSAVPKLK